MTHNIDKQTAAEIQKLMGASDREYAEMRSRLTREDARIIFAGLVHDAIDARSLTDTARDEIQAALDKLLEITK